MAEDCHRHGNSNHGQASHHSYVPWLQAHLHALLAPAALRLPAWHMRLIGC